MAKVTECKTCTKQISATAESCPHCGQSMPGMRIHCPRCDSMNIESGQKGYGWGKAAAGAVLLGPVGLAAGMFGRKKVAFICQDCRKKWKQGLPEVN